MSLVVSGVSTFSKEYGNEYDRDASLEKYEYLVHELDYRRRLQFLFPNPQSIFNGLSIGYVQTSKGNMSFRRRDLVVVSNPTLIASRIYDSRHRTNDGFGPGWRLNLIETIERGGNSAVHTDAVGARQQFQHQDRALFVPLHAVPETNGSTLAFIGDSAVIRNAKGEIRQFAQIDGTNTFVMVRRVSPNGKSITYDFDARKLIRVSLDGEELLQIQWTGDHIVKVRDRHGREVRYEYDDLGRLARTFDLNRQDWRYEYDASNRLINAIYPDGKTYLTIEYDSIDRVSTVIGAREYSFRYFDDVTIVTEPDSIEHTFVKDARGITVGYRSNRGTNWQISMDDSGRLVEFERDSRLYTFGHTDALWTSLSHTEGTLTYHYDEQDRLVGTTGVPIRDIEFPQEISYVDSDETLQVRDSRDMSYRINKQGHVFEVNEGGTISRIDRDKKGNVTSISKNDDKLVFTRNSHGRIETTQYPNNAISRYKYDGLGNRNIVNYSSGARTMLDFDGRGKGTS